MSVIVVATFFPKPGAKDAVRAAISAVISDVHAEPGCGLYALHEAADRFVLIEKWASEEAIDQHGKAPALAALVTAVTPLVDRDIEIINLAPVPVGDPQAGQL